MRSRAVMYLAATVALSATVCAQEPPRRLEVEPAVPKVIPLEVIQRGIAARVDLILAAQREDGSFNLGDKVYVVYPFGSTGLAVTALQYARPHLKGERRTRVFEAIRKGLSYLTQRRHELKTYSAAFVILPLYADSPTRHRKRIGAAAEMLCLGQHDKTRPALTGMWGYNLRARSGRQRRVVGAVETWGDNSNTQIALLGLYFAQRAGFQVPRAVWLRARDHYRRTQSRTGGWGYADRSRPQPSLNMTIAGTISLNLCNEMLLKPTTQCKPPRTDPHVRGGLKWIVDHWDAGALGGDPYGLYTLERLGILMGRANIGGHDWYNEGARACLTSTRIAAWEGAFTSAHCFAVMFLARGLEPIVINKLERRDTDPSDSDGASGFRRSDWNNTPYDIKHLTEYIQDHYQLPVQWRIVTLEAPKHVLGKTPILYIAGHEKLTFTDAERRKLKVYLTEGGTILANACCSKRAFDKSFRDLVKQLFDRELQVIPKSHRIYERMKTRGHAPKPRIEVLTLDDQLKRPAILYLPHGIARNWHLGGKGADRYFAVGAGIYLYVTTDARKMFERSQPGAK